MYNEKFQVDFYVNAKLDKYYLSYHCTRLYLNFKIKLLQWMISDFFYYIYRLCIFGLILSKFRIATFIFSM